MTGLILTFCIGKGITDQDRNILCNQELLLGFFKSAAPFLRHGPSNITLNPKRKHSDNETDDAEEMVDPNDDVEGISDDESGAAATRTASRSARGTILVTLKDKPPYTLWCVLSNS